MSTTDTIVSVSDNILEQTPKENYGVEFFHIYTDEKIGPTHEASLYYLQEAKRAWSFNHKLILLIDDYNPKDHVLSPEEVLSYLGEHGALPDFWAREGDMVDNAKLLLNSLTSNKLRKNYTRYVEQHNKYPCSLLTAAWYLTRLGALPNNSLIKSTSEDEYIPSTRLINILAQDYKPVELRALELIQKSEFGEYLDKIQDLFFPMDSGRKIELW